MIWYTIFRNQERKFKMKKIELERKMLIEDFIDELLDLEEYNNRIIMEETEDDRY